MKKFRYISIIQLICVILSTSISALILYLNNSLELLCKEKL